jgi:hypothetical protein
MYIRVCKLRIYVTHVGIHAHKILYKHVHILEYSVTLLREGAYMHINCSILISCDAVVLCSLLSMNVVH